MKSKIHEHLNRTKMTVSKRLLILSMIIGGTLIATTGYSQVYVGAHLGFRVPAPRVYVSAPAPVVCETPAPAPVAYGADFSYLPEYAYYTYPAWHGHYRDRGYYEHYRPYWGREHRGYYGHRRW